MDKVMNEYNESLKAYNVKLAPVDKIRPSLQRDVAGVVGGMFSLNSPHALGYCFDANGNGSAITAGKFAMFEDVYSEEFRSRYDFFYCYENGRFYRIKEIKRNILH